MNKPAPSRAILAQMRAMYGRPGMSLRRVGDHFGFTGEWVRQLLFGRAKRPSTQRPRRHRAKPKATHADRRKAARAALERDPAIELYRAEKARREQRMAPTLRAAKAEFKRQLRAAAAAKPKKRRRY